MIGNVIEIFDYSLASKLEQSDTSMTSFLSNQYFYIPEKFGRSTLRKIDFIENCRNYTETYYRKQIIFFFAEKETEICLDKKIYLLPKKEIVQINTQAETVLEIKEAYHLWCFAVDTSLDYQDTQKITLQNGDINFGDDKTHVSLLRLSVDDEQAFNPENKPFYVHILTGFVHVGETTISKKSGFYTTKEIKIKTTEEAKILCFLMPIPL